MASLAALPSLLGGALLVAGPPGALAATTAVATPAPPAGPAPPPAPPLVPFLEDPVLERLVVEAIDARPELRQGHARIAAEQARVPQTRTLADPVLTLGIQNDGFSRLQIGKMETSWTTIMASQSFPWFGKRDLRAEVAESQVRRAEAELGRATLAVRAEVERAYLDLLQVLAEAELFARTDALWSQSEGIARTRYETGDGVQSDLLRAQLARNRLRLRLLALDAETARRTVVLNRLRGQPASQALAPGNRLTELADPIVPELARAIEEASTASPELRGAADDRQRAARQLALVRTDFYPDVTVSAGVMPRGGPFETMWQAGLSLSLPVWSLGRTTHAVAEDQARIEAAEATTEGLRCLLEQRVRERHILLAAQVETTHIYRSGLLIQSEATVASTLAQYRVGKVPMTSVLDAMAGYLGDMDGYLASIAAAQRLAIAEREISLGDAGAELAAAGGSGAASGGSATGGTSAGSSGGGSEESGGRARPASGASAGGAASMSKM
jgi:outer membrane protein TolC